MARSLSLTAYLALTRRAQASMPDIETERPDGALVWIHAGDPEKASALVQLARRMVAQRAGLHLLLTVPPGKELQERLPSALVAQEVPPENSTDISRFLGHWHPDMCLWLGSALRPALIDAAARRDMPLVLLDADEFGKDQPRPRWLPEPTKGALRLFDAILCRSDVAAERLRRMGVEDDLILPSGPFLEDSTALPYNEADLKDLSEAIAERPVWLAVKVQLAELDTVLLAHKKAMSLAHRLLLVLIPANPEDAGRFRERCTKEGWRISQWDEGETPGETTQILLAEAEGEMGLWYRVAPVSFMASSLASGHGGCTPYDAAALGSAVIYGPGVGQHLDAYSRLAKAGAVRIVRDADSLSQALIQLNAPDRVAAMAHAGWEVISAGAEVTDQIINLVQDNLDAAGVD